MNEDHLQTSQSHINNNGFMCSPNVDSSPNHKVIATNIETVFQKDLSFSCENSIFSKSSLNFEKYISKVLNLVFFSLNHKFIIIFDDKKS